MRRIWIAALAGIGLLAAAPAAVTSAKAAPAAISAGTVTDGIVAKAHSARWYRARRNFGPGIYGRPRVMYGRPRGYRPYGGDRPYGRPRW